MLLPRSRLFAFSCVLKPEGILCFVPVRGEGKKMLSQMGQHFFAL